MFVPVCWSRGFETLAGARSSTTEVLLLTWFRDARWRSLLNHRGLAVHVVSRRSLALAPQPPKEARHQRDALAPSTTKKRDGRATRGSNMCLKWTLGWTTLPLWR